MASFARPAINCTRTYKNNLNRKSLKYFIRCCQNEASIQKSSEVEHLTTGDIKIPTRIERSSTDILKALSSTVGKDYTAPHYKYHDDPFFIPASNFAKRTYALARDSGQRAAMYFLEKYPEKFTTNHAEPTIDALMPKVTENSLDALEMSILNADVDDAINIYKALQNADEKIPDNITQSLLELLCFYNCEPAPNEQLLEERWYSQNTTERRKTWKEHGLAAKIFDEMENKTPEAYCAMIKGMVKYFSINKAIEMFEDAETHGIKMDVETYNSMITYVIFMKEGSQNRWEHALKLVQSMEEAGIRPNLNTMTNMMELISKFGSFDQSKDYALSTLAEMKRLNIKPSLASYYFMLTIFCKERGPRSPILYDILDAIEHEPFSIQHPKDTMFFVMAMDVCNNHLQDKDLAYRVDKMVNSGDNFLLLGDSFRESVYYQHFFKILCSSESIEKFFEIYHNLVPNTYTPEPSVVQEIIQAIELSGELHYLPHIWSDIVVFNLTNRDVIIEAILTVMSQGGQNETLSKQFSEIAKDVFNRIESIPAHMLRSSINWTGNMLGNMIRIHLNADRFKAAWKVLEKCDVDQSKISGFLNTDTLRKLFNECIRLENTQCAVTCVKYAFEVGYDNAQEFALEINEKLEINQAERLILEGLVGDISKTSPLNIE